MKGPELARYLAVLLIGGATALPIGIWLGGDAEPRPAAPVGADVTGFRQPYSPILLRDPHFLAEQRKGVEALEAHCRTARALCAEAREARRWLTEHAGN